MTQGYVTCNVPFETVRCAFCGMELPTGEASCIDESYFICPKERGDISNDKRAQLLAIIGRRMDRLNEYRAAQQRH